MKGIIFLVAICALVFVAVLLYTTREVDDAVPSPEPPVERPSPVSREAPPEPGQPSETAFDEEGWFLAYGPAVRAAASTGRPLFVDFVAPESLSEKKYRKVYDEPRVAEVLERFIRVRLPMSDAGPVLRVAEIERECMAFMSVDETPLRVMVGEVPGDLLVVAAEKAVDFGKGMRGSSEEMRGKVAQILNTIAPGDQWSVMLAKSELVKLGADVVPALMDTLWGGSAIARVLCVHALGELGDSSVASELSLSLLDPDEEVATEAASALGKVGVVSAVPLLVSSLLPNRPGVSAEVAAALGKLRAKEAAPALMRLLDDPDDNLKLVGIVALGRIGDPSAGERVMKFLGSEEPAIVRGAVIALGFMKYDKVTGRLRDILLDSRKTFDLRHMAAHSLTRIGSADAADALIHGLRKDLVKEPGVRACCAEGLGPTKAKEAVGPLMTSLESDDDAVVRALAARSLGEIGDRYALELLRKNAGREGDVVSFQAKGAMLLLGEKMDTAFIKERLKARAEEETQDDVLTRSGAIFFAGKLGMKDAVPTLIDSLDTYRPFIVRTITTALTEITGHELVLIDEFDRKEVLEVRREWERWWERNRKEYGR